MVANEHPLSTNTDEGRALAVRWCRGNCHGRFNTAVSHLLISARTELAEMPELAFYDPNRPTTLFTDVYLLNGLGFILKQRATSGTRQMEQAGSRFL
jgi:hypothetical protein